MTLVQTAALLITLAATFETINYFFLKLPSTIGILIVALITSLNIFVIDALWPSLEIADTIRHNVENLDFTDTLMEGMLGLLLFAGALHVDVSKLRDNGAVIFLLATLGVAISTFAIGFGVNLILGVPLLIALVYGALISPTDPVAVLGVLRSANLSKSLETQIAGESLFNDGVGYVVFLILASLAFPALSHGEDITFVSGFLLFLQEALGGILLGALLGWLTFKLMKRIDNFSLEVLLSLALAFGGYELALALHVSGPIFAVVAGLFIGDVGKKHAMSELTRAYLDGFWRLIDEILNALLFLLIGFEVFAVNFEGMNPFLVSIFAISISLIGRFFAVSIPITLLRPFKTFSNDVIPLMTWGGVKGGISVALVLSLPDTEWKPLLLTMTYVTVVFSIIVQGLTIAPLAKRLQARFNLQSDFAEDDA